MGGYFYKPELKQIVIDSLHYCQRKKGLVIHGWCLMTSHLHMIVRTNRDWLPDIFRDFKKYTSRKLIEQINNTTESRRQWILPLFADVAEGQKRIQDYKVWQDGNHPILLTKPKFTRQKLDYIHNNPVVEEIVNEPENYLYSSAKDYFTEGRGYLEIERIE